MTKPIIVVSRVDGHVFFCLHRGNMVLLTNEYGAQTWLKWNYARKLLGF